MYLISLVTTRIDVELAAVQRKLPGRVVVGFQLYSARTFHVTLSPQIYKGGQGPPPNIISRPAATCGPLQDGTGCPARLPAPAGRSAADGCQPDVA